MSLKDSIKEEIGRINSEWEAACALKDSNNKANLGKYVNEYSGELGRLAATLEQARTLGVLDVIHEVSAHKILPIQINALSIIGETPTGADLEAGRYGSSAEWNAFVLEPYLDDHGNWRSELKIELFRKSKPLTDLDDGIPEIVVVEHGEGLNYAIRGRNYVFNREIPATGNLENSDFREGVALALVHPMRPSLHDLAYFGFATRQVYQIGNPQNQPALSL